MAFLVLEKPEMPNSKCLLQHFPNKKNYLDDLLMFLAKQFWWKFRLHISFKSEFPRNSQMLSRSSQFKYISIWILHNHLNLRILLSKACH